MIFIYFLLFTFYLSRLMTKPTKWALRPAKIQISLGIRPVWSESSLCAQWVAQDPRFLHANSEDFDQTGQMPRLISVFTERTCPFCWFCHKAAHVSFPEHFNRWIVAHNLHSCYFSNLYCFLFIWFFWLFFFLTIIFWHFPFTLFLLFETRLFEQHHAKMCLQGFSTR